MRSVLVLAVLVVRNRYDVNEGSFEPGDRINVSNEIESSLSNEGVGLLARSIITNQRRDAC